MMDKTVWVVDVYSYGRLPLIRQYKAVAVRSKGGVITGCTVLSHGVKEVIRGAQGRKFFDDLYKMSSWVSNWLAENIESLEKTLHKFESALDNGVPIERVPHEEVKYPEIKL